MLHYIGFHLHALLCTQLCCSSFFKWVWQLPFSFSILFCVCVGASFQVCKRVSLQVSPLPNPVSSIALQIYKSVSLKVSPLLFIFMRGPEGQWFSFSDLQESFTKDVMLTVCHLFRKRFVEMFCFFTFSFLFCFFFGLGIISFQVYKIFTQGCYAGRLPHLLFKKFCWMMWAWIIFVLRQSDFLQQVEFWGIWSQHLLSNNQQGFLSILFDVIFDYQTTQGWLKFTVMLADLIPFFISYLYF